MKYTTTKSVSGVEGWIIVDESYNMVATSIKYKSYPTFDVPKEWINESVNVFADIEKSFNKKRKLGLSQFEVDRMLEAYISGYNDAVKKFNITDDIRSTHYNVSLNLSEGKMMISEFTPILN